MNKQTEKQARQELAEVLWTIPNVTEDEVRYFIDWSINWVKQNKKQN